MLEKYYKFNAERFYEEYNRNEKILKDLKCELDNITFTKVVDYKHTRVSGGETGDPTFQNVKRIESLNEKIKDLEYYFEIERLIYHKLNEKEKSVVDYLKLPRERRSIHKLSDILNFSEKWTYQIISDTEKKVEEIAKWYL